MPYKLSAALAAHSSDVRAVASPTNDLVLSASRDTTAIPWERTSPNQFHNPTIYKASSRYVNAVAFLPPDESSPKGYLIAAGQDAVINLFSLSVYNADPDYSLLGHSDNVCTLDVAADGTIISGSWDKTAKVWKNFQLTYDLKGHQQSVWAVLAVGEDRYLTASADKTIRLWQTNKMIQNYPGHTDAVRGLTLIPDIGFASCSNDSEIRVWTFEGDIVYTLSGHTSFVYSLALLPNGDLISGGEDRTVRIWKDGECSQIITHPAISVWSVSTMPNGDIVSGTSDGMVRVFSTADERWASENEIKEYEEHVARQALPSQQVGDVKKSDLPGLEALNEPGRKPGENKMVRNGDTVELHQWDSDSSTWKKIGDVVDAVGQDRRQLFEGKEYDYVFDVDFQDGVPALKLPYNVTENPFAAAQRFLEKNNLPMSYIDQVVQFIEKNTGGVNLGGGDEYQDPFTGASRYRSAPGNSSSSGQASQYMDPFTGASRYSGTPQSTPSQPASSYQDPFTGANRYSGAPTAPVTPKAPATKVLPVTKPITFKQGNVAAMKNKLFQFNELLQSGISTSSIAISSQEAGKLETAFNYLSQAMAGPPTNPALTPEVVELAVSIMGRWPSAQLFPVVDLSRLLAGFAPEAFVPPGVKDAFVTGLLNAAEWNQPWRSPLPKSRETNILLLLRAWANLFHEKTHLGDAAWANKIIECLGEVPYTILAKTHRVPFATILFNMSVLGLQSALPAELRNTALTLMVGLAGAETDDAEAIYRTLVGIGNFVTASKASGGLNDDQTLSVAQALEPLLTRFADERIQNMSQEILALVL